MAKKSLIAWVLAIGMVSLPVAEAKEKFVKYTEAMRSVKAPQGGSIPCDEVYRKIQAKEKIILMDARPKSDHQKQRIAGSRLPHSDDYYQAEKLFKENITRTRPDFGVYLAKSLRSLPKNSPIVTYCNRNCSLSKTLMNEIKQLGFTDVRWMEGGIDSWREKGYPLESSTETKD